MEKRYNQIDKNLTCIKKHGNKGDMPLHFKPQFFSFFFFLFKEWACELVCDSSTNKIWTSRSCRRVGFKFKKHPSSYIFCSVALASYCLVCFLFLHFQMKDIFSSVNLLKKWCTKKFWAIYWVFSKEAFPNPRLYDKLGFFWEKEPVVEI